jgi:hypothetical protein
MWLLAALMLLNDPEPVEVRGFVDTYWYSANVSRGKIPFARPILFQELELDAVTRDWGQLNFYYAMTHSLSDVRDKVCKRFDIEDDILFTYGYDWKFAEGWQLRSRLGHLWILSRALKPPYKGVDDATAREWYVRETLATPWVNFYAAIHYRMVPYRGVYFKSGVTRTFDLGHGFSLTGEFCAEGGNKEWNANRYGHRITWRKPDYHAGPTDLRAGLTLSYELFENCQASIGIHRFDMIMDEARAQGRYHAAKGYRNDLTYFVAGLFLSF